MYHPDRSIASRVRTGTRLRNALRDVHRLRKAKGFQRSFLVPSAPSAPSMRLSAAPGKRSDPRRPLIKRCLALTCLPPSPVLTCTVSPVSVRTSLTFFVAPVTDHSHLLRRLSLPRRLDPSALVLERSLLQARAALERYESRPGWPLPVYLYRDERFA